MDQIKLGDVTVTRVWEYYGAIGMTSEILLPGKPQ